MTSLDILELHEKHALLHYEYDPDKAREYYLRTRQLKGRRPAAAKPLPAVRRPAAKSGANIARGSLVAKKNNSKAQAQARVAGIQKRLSALEGVLKSLLAEKKAADSKKATDKAKPKAGGKDSGGSEPKRKLTAKQKADNNERAKDYYEKNKKPAAPEKPKEKSLDEKIAYTRSQIKKVKAELVIAKTKAGLK